MLFPQHFIDELKNRADIVRIIGDFVQLKKKGQNHMACCPFHDEKTPSFSVNANKGFYKCFGCGKGGNVFTFLMEIEGVSFPDAVRTVAEKSSVPLPEPVDDKAYARSKKKKEEGDREKKRVIELNKIALNFWEENLYADNHQSKAAVEYLEGREIDSETIKEFRIGFAPDSWDTILNLLKKEGFDEKLIRDSGLVTVNEDKDSVYDRFRGRIIFPVLDINGDPVAFGARTLGSGEPKYLNSPETPAYIKGEHLYGLFHNSTEIRRLKYSILVEGYLDLIALYQFGVKNCVASLGTALTDKQAKLLGRFARKVAVNYDGDSAGIKAAKRAIETFLSQDFEIKVLVLPDGNDPDDYIRSEGFEAYKDQHKNHALPYLQFVLETIVRERNISVPKEKAAAIEDVIPVLTAVRNTVERRETLKQVLRYMQIDDRVLEDHVWNEINKRIDRFVRSPDERAPDEKIKRLVLRQSALKVTVAEQRLLELLIHDSELRKIIFPEMEKTDWEPLGTAPIFEALIELEENGIENIGQSLLEMTDDDETAHELVPTLLMSDAHRDEDEAIDEVLFEAENCAARLRSMAIERRILDISRELAFAEQANDQDSLDRLVAEQIELAKLKREIENRLSNENG
ncbi:MAG: DNA primase [Pyrinomonadaceae bacterium]|nr:DNA primase [Pyrinomonadaceae bacterium]